MTMPLLALGLLAVIPTRTPTQVACVGTDAQCREAQKKTCADEKAPANLLLPTKAVVTGRVSDVTGAPLGLGFWVQLRTPDVSTVSRTVSLDVTGRFVFGVIEPGSYRIIVVQIRNGLSQRFGFEQPKELQCKGEKACELKVVLQAAGTDHRVNFCSPK